MIYVNNAELEKIFGSSSNITFSTVQVESFLRRNTVFEQIGTDLNKLKRLKTLLNTGENQKNAMK